LLNFYFHLDFEILVKFEIRSNIIFRSNFGILTNFRSNFVIHSNNYLIRKIKIVYFFVVLFRAREHKPVCAEAEKKSLALPNGCYGLSPRIKRGCAVRGNQFAVTKFLATGSQVSLFAAITLRVQKPLSNSLEGLFWVKFV
jgi:hypothetical protein